MCSESWPACFFLNELEATKGLLNTGFGQKRVEVSLRFIFDIAAVKAGFHHNCFLSPFKMVFRSPTPPPYQVC